MSKREVLSDMGYDHVVVFSNPDYDDAIIGIDTNERAVYSFSKMVEHLMKADDISEEDAIEFIEYNTIR